MNRLSWPAIAVAACALAAGLTAGAASETDGQLPGESSPSGAVFEFRLHADGQGRTTDALVTEIIGRWPAATLPAVVHYNPNGAPAGLEVNASLLSAAQAWNAAPGQYFRFAQGSDTGISQDLNPLDGCSKVHSKDGISTVQWAHGWGPPGLFTPIATTCVWGGLVLDDNKSRLVEFDTWLNADATWSSSTATPSLALDLQSVLVHEFGHALGLGHDPEPSAVMHNELKPGHQRRALTAADVEGIRTLYGNNLRLIVAAVAFDVPVPSLIRTVTLLDDDEPEFTTNDLKSITLVVRESGVQVRFTSHGGFSFAPFPAGGFGGLNIGFWEADRDGIVLTANVLEGPIVQVAEGTGEPAHFLAWRMEGEELVFELPRALFRGQSAVEWKAGGFGPGGSDDFDWGYWHPLNIGP